MFPKSSESPIKSFQNAIQKQLECVLSPSPFFCGINKVVAFYIFHFFPFFHPFQHAQTSSLVSQPYNAETGRQRASTIPFPLISWLFVIIRAETFWIGYWNELLMDFRRAILSVSGKSWPNCRRPSRNEQSSQHPKLSIYRKDRDHIPRMIQLLLLMLMLRYTASLYYLCNWRRDVFVDFQGNSQRRGKKIKKTEFECFQKMHGGKVTEFPDGYTKLEKNLYKILEEKRKYRWLASSWARP